MEGPQPRPRVVGVPRRAIDLLNDDRPRGAGDERGGKRKEVAPDVHERSGAEAAGPPVRQLSRARREKASEPIEATGPWVAWLDEPDLPAATAQPAHDLVDVGEACLAFLGWLETDVVELSLHRRRRLRTSRVSLVTGVTRVGESRASYRRTGNRPMRAADQVRGFTSPAAAGRAPRGGRGTTGFDRRFARLAAHVPGPRAVARATNDAWRPPPRRTQNR